MEMLLRSAAEVGNPLCAFFVRRFFQGASAPRPIVRTDAEGVGGEGAGEPVGSYPIFGLRFAGKRAAGKTILRIVKNSDPRNLQRQRTVTTTRRFHPAIALRRRAASMV